MEKAVALAISSLVDFWSAQYRSHRGQWLHPADEEVFTSHTHSFNLHFPVSPFVGNVLTAPVVILGANARYCPEMTAEEFPESAIETYLARVRHPDAGNWTEISPYYKALNYGQLIATGQAVLVNACAYRSPKISSEPDNQWVVRELASVGFTREWLVEAVLPLALTGARLIVAKRPGLWNLAAEVMSSRGVVVDRAPRAPMLTGESWRAVNEYLASQVSRQNTLILEEGKREQGPGEPKSGERHGGKLPSPNHLRECTWTK